MVKLDKIMNVDIKEIEKFSDLSDSWWDEKGQLWTLHRVNPLRIKFIKRCSISLDKKQVLDVGCGGGILSEAMAKEGALVTGLDLSEGVINVARAHAKETNYDINYVCQPVEDYTKAHKETFDVVTALEMLEHVPDPKAVISACYQALKPGGIAFFSTLNRNVKSYLLAIVAAEYVMGMIPRGTHQYHRFIKPSELVNLSEAVGFEPYDMTGIHYNPITKHFKLGKNIDVNYILACKKAG